MDAGGGGGGSGGGGVGGEWEVKRMFARGAFGTVFMIASSRASTAIALKGEEFFLNYAFGSRDASRFFSPVLKIASPLKRENFV